MTGLGWPRPTNNVRGNVKSTLSIAVARGGVGCRGPLRPDATTTVARTSNTEPVDESRELRESRAGLGRPECAYEGAASSCFRLLAGQRHASLLSMDEESRARPVPLTPFSAREEKQGPERRSIQLLRHGAVGHSLALRVRGKRYVHVIISHTCAVTYPRTLTSEYISLEGVRPTT